MTEEQTDNSRLETVTLVPGHDLCADDTVKESNREGQGQTKEGRLEPNQEEDRQLGFPTTLPSGSVSYLLVLEAFRSSKGQMHHNGK